MRESPQRNWVVHFGSTFWYRQCGRATSSEVLVIKCVKERAFQKSRALHNQGGKGATIPVVKNRGLNGGLEKQN
jgi:hypothetical protein